MQTPRVPTHSQPVRRRLHIRYVALVVALILVAFCGLFALVLNWVLPKSAASSTPFVLPAQTGQANNAPSILLRPTDRVFVPLTDTPIPSPTALPEPTSTPIQPIDTPIPTNTPTNTPIPTNTPLPTPTPQTTPTSPPAGTAPAGIQPTPVSNIASIGQRIVSEPNTLTVIRVGKAEQTGAGEKPKPGNMFVIAEVLIEAQQERILYNPLYFTMKDQNDVAYTSITTTDIRALKAGELQKGDKATGIVIFELPMTVQHLVITYQRLPLMSGDQEIVVKIF